MRAPAATGGWTSSGWSDDVSGPVSSVPAARPLGSAPSQAGGGWTREEWSTGAAAKPSAAAPAGAARGVQGVVPPPAPRRLGVDAAGRLLPWDGGHGPAFRYERGQRLPVLFVEQPYRVDDWIGYGLPVPPTGARWIRYFNDAVMIDESAMVIDAVPGIDWTTPPAIYGATPRVIDTITGEARPAQTDGSITTTEIRSTPGGGRIMVTTTTTPEVATTTMEEHEVP
ncbi:RcnB family protein [Sphingomonas solaris]|uniref:RcnB family protein n=1 Tax=Alterirhizorhabdus solaris TaxID=2529389 RepID=UPI001396888D|nr:RcnB family protein [Sphingomonas solaris]